MIFASCSYIQHQLFIHYDGQEPALYAVIFLLFFINGAGPLSVDEAIYDAIKSDDD